MEQIAHPGSHIREHVIPTELNVKEAAKKLEVSRPTLSNLLNGNADLSPEMAGRLAKVFGADADDLLSMQSTYDARKLQNAANQTEIISYVPPFLEIKASSISAWAGSGLNPRQRFAVFLRTLANSTCMDISRIDFPGNDDSQRPGHDGQIDCDHGNPWIPAGRSIWEFGVNKNIKQKANDDYAKTVKAMEPDECADATYVFVTPHSWAGKSKWQAEHRKKGIFADVRAYDASDLEQWLAQSIPGQVWFANEIEEPARGAISLDYALREWMADCEPSLHSSLFDSAVEQHRASIKRILNSDPAKSGLILSDSRDEALGFLSCAFASDDKELGQYRDRVIIFREPGTFAKLATKTSNFIPVVMSAEVERELAPFRKPMPSFRVYQRNASSNEPDIVLETLNYEAFDKALQQMGFEHERITKLSRETGRSLTVLRRRLSQLDAIQKPTWADDPSIARMLVPVLFAGTWKKSNDTDCMMIEGLAGDQSVEEIEQQMTELLPLDGTPVWATGEFRGVISKIDVLFAIRNAITEEDLKRFYTAAELILSEPDPSLELPEDERWAAGIHGKTRKLSAAMRDGVAEMLVLLSVHGKSLFGKRMSFDCEFESKRLVSKMLMPLENNTLETHIDNLPLYAEAAPETFLKIIEDDLDQNDSKTMALIRPKGDSPFASSPRTGLLWALENLAWTKELFPRVVMVLGKLSEKPLEDNLMNKPMNSLGSMFRNWMPQTSADIVQRKAALTKLAETHPDVAWPICMAQIDYGPKTGHYSHKPRWRPDGHGYGQPTTYQEMDDFSLKAFEIAISWPNHTVHTISDLLRHLRGLDETLGEKVWDLLEEFTKKASNSDKAILRETIRTTALSRRASLRGKDKSVPETIKDRAWAAYRALEPTDILQKHEWLFRKTWIDETASELEDEDYDYKSREKRIEALRIEAVREIYEQDGLDGILALAEAGQAAQAVGRCLAKVLSNDADLLPELQALTTTKGPVAGTVSLVLSGALHCTKWDERPVLEALLHLLDDTQKTAVLCISTFEKTTWDILGVMDKSIQDTYWQEVPAEMCFEDDDIPFAVSKLLEADRPRAAFHIAHYKLETLEAKQLLKVLQQIVKSSNEPQGHYKIDGYYVRDALKILTDSKAASTEELGAIEFQFLDIFDLEQGRPVNLEKWVEKDPDLFVQSVVFAFKRKDGAEDPPELRIDDKEKHAGLARQSYKLLSIMRRVPGYNDKDELTSENLLHWIETVRSKCNQLSRGDIGDQMIGQLLAHAPNDDDGLWPCKPVRDVLEVVLNDNIASGMHMARFNSRGAHWRGEGGDQERAIAAEYGGWANKIEYTHPKVGSFLRDMEKQYLRDAEREDQESQINRRIRLS